MADFPSDLPTRPLDAEPGSVPDDLIRAIYGVLPEFALEYRYYSYEWRGPIGPGGLSAVLRFALGHPAINKRSKLSLSIPMSWSTLNEARIVQALLARLIAAASILEKFDEETSGPRG